MTAAALAARAPRVVPALPIRVDPELGESFHGYLARTATLLHLRIPTLLQPLTDLRPELLLPTSSRVAGIAATAPTIELLARRFNLDPSQVRGLFLEAHAPFLQITDAERQDLDPFNPHPPRRSPLDAARGVRSPKARYRCRSCQREKPDQWEVSWLLTLHQACLHHREYLTDARHPDEKPQPAYQPALDAQAEILDLVRSGTHVEKLRRWSAALAGDGILEPILRDLLPPPDPCLDPGLLPRDGAADLLNPFLPAVRVRYQDPLTVAPEPVPNERLSMLPKLIPIEIYTGGLSDLCYPLISSRGRRITRVCMEMYLSGCKLPDAAARLGHSNSVRPAVALLAQLESHGRLESFWSEIMLESERLAAGQVDYRRRERMIRDGSAYEAIRRAERDRPVNSNLAIRAWLVDRWASLDSSGQEDSDFGVSRADRLRGRQWARLLALLESRSARQASRPGSEGQLEHPRC